MNKRVDLLTLYAFLFALCSSADAQQRPNVLARADKVIR